MRLLLYPMVQTLPTMGLTDEIQTMLWKETLLAQLGKYFVKIGGQEGKE